MSDIDIDRRNFLLGASAVAVAAAVPAPAIPFLEQPLDVRFVVTFEPLTVEEILADMQRAIAEAIRVPVRLLTGEGMVITQEDYAPLCTAATIRVEVV